MQNNSLFDNKADLVNGKVPSIQLSNIEVPAQSVNSKTGAVVLTKLDIGLGNVDNTADSAKAVLFAIKLATPRAINVVNFDGTALIIISDSAKAPISHASTATTYVVCTIANYGHVKLRDSLVGTVHVDGQVLNSHKGYVLDQNKMNKGVLLRSLAFATLTHNGVVSMPDYNWGDYDLIAIELSGTAVLTNPNTSARYLSLCLDNLNCQFCTINVPASTSNHNVASITGRTLLYPSNTGITSGVVTVTKSI